MTGIPAPSKTWPEIAREIGKVLMISAAFAAPALWAAGPWPALVVFTALASGWITTLALRPIANPNEPTEPETPEERAW